MGSSLPPQKPWFSSAVPHHWDHFGAVLFWGDRINKYLHPMNHPPIYMGKKNDPLGWAIIGETLWFLTHLLTRNHMESRFSHGPSKFPFFLESLMMVEMLISMDRLKFRTDWSVYIHNRRSTNNAQFRFHKHRQNSSSKLTTGCYQVDIEKRQGIEIPEDRGIPKLSIYIYRWDFPWLNPPAPGNHPRDYG